MGAHHGDPHCIDRLIQGARGVLHYPHAHSGKVLKLDSTLRISLDSRLCGGLFREILGIDGKSLQRNDHGLPRGILAYIARVLLHVRPYLLDDAPSSLLQDAREIGDNVGKRRGFKGEIYGEAFVNPLCKGVVVFAAYTLPEVFISPVREDLMVEDPGFLFRDIIGEEQPVWNGEEFGPEICTGCIHIRQSANGFGSRSTCNEVTFPDDRLSVFHDVLEDIPPPEFRNPRRSVGLGVKAVSFMPLSHELWHLDANLSLGVEMEIEKSLKAGEILKGILRQIGVFQEFHSGIYRVRLHAVCPPFGKSLA